MAKKSNKNVTFVKDDKKTYIYIKDGRKDVGMLCWHFAKKQWVFDNWQKKHGRKKKAKG